MNYELAKQLKDAGFTLQVASQQDSICKREMFQYGKDSIGRDNTWWLEPTLSELIEACGDGFNQLIRSKFLTENNKIEWMATEGSGNSKSAIGSTPEEAVAHLWLELNKK